MDWHHILSFAVMAALIEISPGPNFLLITRSVSTVGNNVALANIPGFSVAFAVHGALSIYGVSSFLTANHSMLMVVQLTGAAYLFYLGAQSIVSAKRFRLQGSRVSAEPMQTEKPDSVFGGRNKRRMARVRQKKLFAAGGVGQCDSFQYIDIVLDDIDTLPDGVVVADEHRTSYVRYFLDGLLTNILKPKIAFSISPRFRNLLASNPIPLMPRLSS